MIPTAIAVMVIGYFGAVLAAARWDRDEDAMLAVFVLMIGWVPVLIGVAALVAPETFS